MENERIRFIGNVHVGVDVKVDELRAVLRRDHLRHRRRARPVAAHPRRGPAALATARPTSSRSTTRTPTASRPGTCRRQPSVAVVGVGNVGLDVARMLARDRRRAAVHRHPAARARGAGATPPSPTCTCSPGAARRRPSSPRSSCASWTTRRTCRSSSRPRAWSSTPSRRPRSSRQQVAADGRRRAVRVGDARPGARPAPPDPHPLPGEPGRGARRRDGAASSGCAPSGRSCSGDGTVRGTGEFTDWDVQAVYRAVGYRSEAIEDLPFDPHRLVLPNDGGRVLDLDGDAAARALRHRLGASAARSG